MAARIRKGDTVLVTTGKSKGQRGEVLRVFPEAAADSPYATSRPVGPSRS